MEGVIEATLKNAAQRALARLQDAIIESLMEVEPAVVLHGGTAIWRCYGGNRFSEDIDVYATDAQVDAICSRLTWPLRARGATLEYSAHSTRLLKVSNGEVRSRLEAMEPPHKMKPVQKEYAMVDGSKIFVNTLSVEDFISEKANTYSKRRYARDLYDLYQLTAAQKPSGRSRRLLSSFIKDVKTPVDGEKLRDLVYIGIAPSFDTMVTYINEAVS